VSLFVLATRVEKVLIIVLKLVNDLSSYPTIAVTSSKVNCTRRLE
jgi:hypothetical protein